MIQFIVHHKRSIFILALVGLFEFCSVSLAAEQFPIGKAYQGPKCFITVGDFTVRVNGAPQTIGDGIQEMLKTALFESNYFRVLDRSEPPDINQEKLLSEAFMSDPDAILSHSRNQKAKVLIYGAITTIKKGGSGIRVKAPGAPVKIGGAYHKAKVTIDFRLIESAQGRLLDSYSINGTAYSGKYSAGAALSNNSLPIELAMVKNTPLELAIRDCIYRSVLYLCKNIPKTFFKH